MRLQIFGAPRVLSDSGEDLALPVGKPLAALCLVALRPHRVDRAQLAEILWPEASPDRGRASVRQALWVLRQHLPADTLEEGPRGLTLAGELATDLDELEAALGSGDADAAVGLWQGGPLVGLDIPDVPLWERWRDQLRDLWQRRLGDFLEEQAAAADGEDRLQLLEWARDIRPYRSVVHAEFAATHLALGRAQEARRILLEARAHLPSGADPEPLDAMARRLEALERAAEREVAGHESGQHRLTLPLTARADALARLHRGLWEARRDRRLVIRKVVGAAGTGRTRLVRDFAALAEHEGVEVVSLVCGQEQEEVEYGLASRLVAGLLRLPGALGISQEADRVLHFLAPSAGRGGEPTPFRPPAGSLADALSDLVQAVGQEAPLVVVLDDVQSCDAASRALLAGLLQHPVDVPLLLVAAQRRVRTRGLEWLEPRTDAAATGDGREIVRLSALDLEETRVLLDRIVERDGGHLFDALVRRLHLVTGGFPDRLTALLRGLVADGLLTEEGERFRAPPELLRGTVDLAERIRPHVEARKGHLSDQAIGLSRWILSGVGSRTSGSEGLSDEERSALDQFLDAGLIRNSRSGGLEPTGQAARLVVSSGMDRRSVAWRWAAAAVVMAGFLLAFLWRAPPPLPGYLVVTLDDGHRAQMWRPDRAGRWVLLDSIGRTPDTVRVVGGAVTLDGSTRWSGWSGTQARSPDVLSVSSSGARLLLDRGGDDLAGQFSPDGSQMLVSSEAPEAAGFRQDLLALRVADGHTETLFSPPAWPIGSEWRSDGRRILAGAHYQGVRDSVFVLHPDGSVVQRLAAPEGMLQSVRYCGPEVLALVLPPGRLVETVRWAQEDGEWVPTEHSRDRRRWSCSPDGTLVAIAEADEAGNQVRIVERGTGRERGRLPLVGEAFRIFWYPAPAPIPTRLEARPFARALSWGAPAALEAHVHLSNGDAGEEAVSWRSLDPSIVSVRGDTAVGNRPGRTRLVATADGWLQDTIEVEVELPAGKGGALILDELDRFVPEDWQVLGNPNIEVAGDSALRIITDARYTDGLMRVGLPAAQGLTAEIEFRLPLTRRDQQAIHLCLAEQGRPEPGQDPAWRPHWPVAQEVCVNYPGWELELFDPSEARLSRRGASLGPVRVPGLPSDDWVHLAVQVRADGQAELAVHRQVLASHPDLLTLGSETQLDLIIWVRTSDTSILLRNLAVWAGGRYGG